MAEILKTYSNTGRRLTTEEVDGNWDNIEDRFRVIESPGTVIFKKPGNTNIKTIQVGDIRMGFLDNTTFGTQQWSGSSWVELTSNTVL